MIHVVLYEPEIPANTGNIMRTCAALGCSLDLIEPLGFYLDEPHLRRAGMDYIRQVKYSLWEDWDRFTANNNGLFFYITRYGKKPPSAFSFRDIKEDIYLVFGKESTGLPKEILRPNIERCIRIPMRKEARALNLANCVAVILYEVYRQTDYIGLSLSEFIKGEDFLER